MLKKVHFSIGGDIPILTMTRRLSLSVRVLFHHARLAVCLVLLTAGPGGSQTPDEPLTLVSTQGRQPLPTVAFDGRRMVDLRELAAPFGLTIAADRQPGRVTVLRGEQVIVLTANQGLVSVAGRLVSLPSPPVQRAGVWYVPIDFIGRALALVHDQTVELRRRSGLVVIGDIRVAQVVARYQRTGPQSRLRLMITPATEHVIRQEIDRLVITFEADALDLVLPDIAPDNLVTGLRGIETSPALTVDLGDAFGTYASVSEPAIGGAVELVIDLQPTPVTSARVVPPPAPAVPTPADAAPDFDLPALSELAPPRTVRAIAIDPGHGGDDTGTRGPDGHPGERCHVERRAPAAEHDRESAGAPGHADPDRRHHRSARRAGGDRQQRPGRSVHQPPHERVGPRIGYRRRGLLSQRRRVR